MKYETELLQDLETTRREKADAEALLAATPDDDLHQASRRDLVEILRSRKRREAVILHELEILEPDPTA